MCPLTTVAYTKDRSTFQHQETNRQVVKRETSQNVSVRESPTLTHVLCFRWERMGFGRIARFTHQITDINHSYV